MNISLYKSHVISHNACRKRKIVNSENNHISLDIFLTIKYIIKMHFLNCNISFFKVQKCYINNIKVIYYFKDILDVTYFLQKQIYCTCCVSFNKEYFGSFFLEKVLFSFSKQCSQCFFRTISLFIFIFTFRYFTIQKRAATYKQICSMVYY